MNIGHRVENKKNIYGHRYVKHNYLEKKINCELCLMEEKKLIGLSWVRTKKRQFKMGLVVDC